MVALVAILAFLLFPWFFRTFFPQYTESVQYAKILLLPFLFAAPTIINSIWFAKAEIKRLYFLKIVFSFSRIALFVGLIPVYSIMGAVWANVIAAFLISFIIFGIYLKDRRKFANQEIL